MSEAPFASLRARLADAETALMVVAPRPTFVQVALDAIRDVEAMLTEIEHG